jgi:predicted transcriptional regulator
MNKRSYDELLDMYEILLKAQLDAVDQLKQGSNSKTAKTLNDQKDSSSKGRSQIKIVYDILVRCGKPTHINEIIHLAKEWYNISLERESLVSALTKKVKRGERFIRTKPNTFGITSREESQS